MTKIKEILKKLRFALPVIAPALLLVVAHASSPAPASFDATAFGDMSSTLLGAITAIVPYALAVVGVVLAWKFGVRFFKSMAK